MPINQSEYQDFLQDVVREAMAARQNSNPLVSIYHHIRNIPYGGAGQRDPQKVYTTRLGTCSGKHILLRDALRSAGYGAEVLTIYTFFNKGIPDHASMPDELRDIIRNKAVSDYHHFVQVLTKYGSAIALDATWHDSLKNFGFPVNNNWVGYTDTQLAGEPIHSYNAVEDVASLKQSLLASLSTEETTLRTRFLKLLTAWMSGIQNL